MKRLLAVSLIAAAMASGPAFAQTAPAVGPYVGASIGSSNYSIDECIGNCDKTDIGGKVFGGYMFTPYLGAELSYQAFGKAKVGFTDTLNGVPVSVNGEAKSSGFGAFFVAQYPIDNFRLFGKIGFGWLDNEFNVTVPGVGSASDSDSSTEFAWGLGATYMINKNFGIRGEYENFKYKFQDISDHITLWSIGLQYNF
jgi:opacity protein-like surface antigen